MAKETIEIVKKAEEEAHQIGRDADKKCEELTAAAQKRHSDLLASFDGETRKKGEQVLKEAREEARIVMIQAAEAADREAAALVAAAQQAKPQAVAAIIRQVTGE